MNTPAITLDGAKKIIREAKERITKNIMQYVDQQRLDLASAQKYLIAATVPHQAAVMILAIRGYFKNTIGKPNVNDRGIYDDAIILIGPNYYKTFNGNTDPRIVKNGVGMLLPGWHLFKQGWHGYGRSTGHKAFRSGNVREVLPGLRDGEYGIKELVTVNIHRGGQYQTNSIACQTIIADQWLTFQRDAYKLMETEGQKIIPYLLVEE